MMRAGNVLAFAILAAAAASAQSDSTATFKSGVTVIQVPVVVRDHDGRVVDNLTKDDFQLFDDGKRQEIASFSGEGPGQGGPDRSVASTPEHAAPSAMPGRFILWFFDDLTIRDTGDLTRLRDAATRQVGTVQPSDRVAVFTTSCHVRLDFTGDRQKLEEALSRLQVAPVMECRVARTESPQIVFLRELVKRMATLPGRRDIVLISSGFLVGADRSHEEAQLVNEAVANKVAISAFDMQEPAPGMYCNGGRCVGDAGGPADPAVLTELAHSTGGSYVTGNDYTVDFRKLATPESHYMLGFVPAKTDDKVHQLKVKLTNPHGLKVEARKSWYAPKRAD